MRAGTRTFCAKEYLSRNVSVTIISLVDIVIDLDQTLFPLLRSMRSVPGGERVHENCGTWDGLEDLCDRPLHNVIRDAIQPERALRVGLYSGAIEALFGWQEAGKEIAIATHRDRSHRPETEEFLQEVGLGDFPLWVDADLQKTDLLYPGGVFIDDAPHLLEEAYTSGVRVASLRHSYNRDILERYSIPSGSWEDIYSLLGTS